MVGRVVSFVGMGLAGLGGMLIGLDTTIDPLTGFRSMLSIFAAAVVGGLGSIDYRSAVGFLAILLVLTLRPRGILGQRAL
jgi:branched-chain amino acid transport system permease protein/neutral amino acid transport system permease protein